jgi:hypothetical protein
MKWLQRLIARIRARFLRSSRRSDEEDPFNYPLF